MFRSWRTLMQDKKNYKITMTPCKKTIFTECVSSASHTHVEIVLGTVEKTSFLIRYSSLQCRCNAL